MIVDLNDLIYFENDVMPEEGNFTMTDSSNGHKPRTTITGDFDIGVYQHETPILFAAYASKLLCCK